MLDPIPWLLALGILGFMALVYFLDKRVPHIWPRRRVKADAYCAWCIYRDGEDCTNPASPVYPGPCGPVCIGEKRCGVRQVIGACGDLAE
jgi:hypothetical protein